VIFPVVTGIGYSPILALLAEVLSVD